MTQIGQNGMLSYRQTSPSTEVYFTWNPFGGNDGDLTSKGDIHHKLTTNSTPGLDTLDKFAVYDEAITPGSEKICFRALNDGGPLMTAYNTSNNAGGQGIIVQAGTTATGTLIAFRDNGGLLSGANITHNGTAVAYNTSSDKKLKNNIKDTSLKALDKINDGKVRDWEWKKDGKKSTGFVAQELLDVYPDAVFVPDPSMEDQTMGIDYGKLTPMLWKAIQEQQVQIEEMQRLMKQHNII